MQWQRASMNSLSVENAFLVQAVDLAEDSLRIDNNTRADDVDALRIQDAGRNQLQLVLLTAGYNGVTGIVAALAADNQIRLACENIINLPLLRRPTGRRELPYLALGFPPFLSATCSCHAVYL